MKEIKICGLQKTTLLDYPGYVAAAIFLGGCNFRCPFCHNGELLGNDLPSQYTAEEILTFLRKRQKILEGVCITGGEPTLQPDALEDFLLEIRSLGLRIKLDTNGNHPEVLYRLIEKDLIDMIAMDIKAAPSRYGIVCGVPGIDLTPIKESLSLLKSGVLSYELRTTAVKGLHTLKDFEEIGPWINGCSHYYIQNYAASDRVLAPNGLDSFSKNELLSFANAVKPYVEQVALRGIDY